MTGWHAFQFVFDVVVGGLIVFFVLSEVKNRKNAPDLEGLKSLVEEFKEAVEKSQKEALNLDPGHKNASASKTAPSRGNSGGLDPAAMGNGGPQTFRPRPAGIEMEKRKVGALHRQGLSKVEISRQLGIPLPEVDLIIAMLASDD